MKAVSSLNIAQDSIWTTEAIEAAGKARSALHNYCLWTESSHNPLTFLQDQLGEEGNTVAALWPMLTPLEYPNTRAAFGRFHRQAGGRVRHSVRWKTPTKTRRKGFALCTVFLADNYDVSFNFKDGSSALYSYSPSNVMESGRVAYHVLRPSVYRGLFSRRKRAKIKKAFQNSERSTSLISFSAPNIGLFQMSSTASLRENGPKTFADEVRVALTEFRHIGKMRSEDVRTLARLAEADLQGRQVTENAVFCFIHRLGRILGLSGKLLKTLWRMIWEAICENVQQLRAALALKTLEAEAYRVHVARRVQPASRRPRVPRPSSARPRPPNAPLAPPLG